MVLLQNILKGKEMKNIKILTSTLSVALMLVFSGCAQTTPTPSSNNIMDADPLQGDTISMDESDMVTSWEEEGYINESGELLGNTSSDGFQSTYFGFDKYAISQEMYDVIEKNTQNAKKVSGNIKIEGNCDSYGSEEYNYALGLKRAKAVKDAMISQGIQESRIVLVSMGEANPACVSTNSKTCMSKNRRADISISR